MRDKMQSFSTDLMQLTKQLAETHQQWLCLQRGTGVASSQKCCFCFWLPTGLKTVTLLSFQLCPTFLLTFSLLFWCPIWFLAISRVLPLLMWHFVSFAHPDSLNLQHRFEMKGSDQDAKLEAQNIWVSNEGVQTSWGFLTLGFLCQIPIYFPFLG